MHRSGRYPYFEGDALQALEMPYKGNDLSLIVLLPQDQGGLAELVSPARILALNSGPFPGR